MLLKLIPYYETISVNGKQYASKTKNIDIEEGCFPVFAFLSLGENGVYASPQFYYAFNYKTNQIEIQLHVGNWSDSTKNITCNINVVYAYEN